MRASKAIKTPTLSPVKKNAVPIKASELVKRRHTDAIKALERALEQREEAFAKLYRAHNKVWKIARQVQRYEKGLA